MSDNGSSQPSARLDRITGWVLTLLLLVLPVCLALGHRSGSASGLSLLHSYVSEYESSAPHWPWIVVSILIFSLLLLVLAFGFLIRLGNVPLAMLGCVMLAAAATPMFFVAYAPVRRVEQPGPEHLSPWRPSYWFMSRTARTPREQGEADAYSHVHYQAIRLAVAAGLLGIVVLAAGLLGVPAWRVFAIASIACAVAMAVLFAAGDWSARFHGLWQRMGLALMYAWAWIARLKLGMAPLRRHW
jgi:hypothetical protein